MSGDNDSPQLLKKYSEGVDVIVHEATFTEDVLARVGKLPQHSSAKMVAAFANSISLDNLILTHFSARYSDYGESPTVSDIEDEARKEYSGRLFLAKDLEVFKLNKAGELNNDEL